MSFHNEGLITLIQAFWVLSLFLLVRLALIRMRVDYTQSEWKYQTQISQIRPRGNIITLMKIYSKVNRSTPRELAQNLRDEMSGNAAMFYRKPNAFFVKYRTNDKIMKQFFKDDELRLFFKDPKSWAILNGAVNERFFGLIRDEGNPSDRYISNLESIIRKFENELAAGKRKTELTL